jgi:hypothetical protein
MTAPVEGGRVVERVPDELRVDAEPHVIILGGGPNRIGQGIEFDYLLRPRGNGSQMAGISNCNGQFESGDREHGLRHIRLAFFRTAHF